MKYIFFYKTPIGKLGVVETSGAITHILFENSEMLDCEKKETPLIKQAGQELAEYFAGTRKKFDIEIKMEGTEFQKKVWRALMKIPYGKTVSYKDIAEKINNPKGMRAVGMANNRNHIPIIIPCHRVIGANGTLIGYAGGLSIKQSLLDLENPKK